MADAGDLLALIAGPVLPTSHPVATDRAHEGTLPVAEVLLPVEGVQWEPVPLTPSLYVPSRAWAGFDKVPTQEAGGDRLLRPTVGITVPTCAALASGDLVTFPRWPRHLLADDNGGFPAPLPPLTAACVEAELEKDTLLGWWWNGAQMGRGVLAVGEGAYVPSVLAFHETPNGAVWVRVLDVWEGEASGSLERLVALAEYAGARGDGGPHVLVVVPVGDGEVVAVDLRSRFARAGVLGAASLEEALGRVGERVTHLPRLVETGRE